MYNSVVLVGINDSNEFKYRGFGRIIMHNLAVIKLLSGFRENSPTPPQVIMPESTFFLTFWCKATGIQRGKYYLQMFQVKWVCQQKHRTDSG